MLGTFVMIAAGHSASEIDSSFFKDMGFPMTPGVINPSFVEHDVRGSDYKQVILHRLEDWSKSCEKSDVPGFVVFDMNQMYNRITAIGFRDLVTKTISLHVGIVVICGEEERDDYTSLIQSIQRSWPSLYT